MEQLCTLSLSLSISLAIYICVYIYVYIYIQLHGAIPPQSLGSRDGFMDRQIDGGMERLSWRLGAVVLRYVRVHLRWSFCDAGGPLSRPGPSANEARWKKEAKRKFVGLPTLLMKK
jgi:hypothetical protein